ncbi:MAG: hypothetical protein WEC81_00095 [Patescibacteria group bacterium]
MNTRFWLYLLAAIIISGLGSYLSWVKTSQAGELAAIERQAAETRLATMDSYLAKQTDGRKMISLAKKVEKSAPELVEPIVLKAYELLPNSRDAALLASHYRPELKDKVKELDPLYSQ